MKKVAIYARVSTEEQKNNYSIGEQIEQLVEYCERQKWEVKKQYVDPGFSGANINRPALQKLLLEAQSYDVVVVWKLDRLSRSIIDTMTIIERDLLAKNVQFVALAENINTESPTWVTQAGIYSTIAQSEREAITERMQMGKLARARSGKPMSWANAPFGYKYSEDRESYEISTIEADVVRYMFNNYLKIESVSKLMINLNEQGHVGKDVKWSYRTVKHVLDNPVYKGYNRYKGDLYKGNHEPIIDEQTFDKVQILMEKRRVEALEKINPRPFQTTYMLSGQIKCGYCDAPMALTQTKRKNGTRYRRYICTARYTQRGSVIYNENKKCTRSGIHPMEELEAYVVSEISKIQLDNNLVYEYSKDTNDKLATLSDYKNQLEANRKTASRIINLYMAELIDEKEMQDRSKNLKSEENYLKNKIKELNEDTNDALDFLKEKKKRTFTTLVTKNKKE